MTEPLEYDLTLYPAPVLREVAAPLEEVDEEARALVQAMFATMYKSQGVGLAAPQVGLKKRILVANPTGEPEDELVLINARIVERSGPESDFDEGCLSFPGIYAEVRRPEVCRVEALDIEGKPFEAEYDGFLSRIIQHEYDHLEGVLLVDRMSPADKHRHRRALQDLVDDYRAVHGEPPRRRR